MKSGIFLFPDTPESRVPVMPSFHRSMVSGNTAFTFRQGLQKEGRAVVTLPPRFVLSRHADIRTDGIKHHTATAELSGWPDPSEAWWQSHRFFLYFPFPDVLVPRWPLGFVGFLSC